MYHYHLDPIEVAFSEASVAWSYFGRVSPLILGVVVANINEKRSLLQTEIQFTWQKDFDNDLRKALHVPACLRIRYTFVLISTLMAWLPGLCMYTYPVTVFLKSPAAITAYVVF